MRKSELKVGEEYAIGSSSRYERYRGVKATVVEVAGERRRENGTTMSGIVCEADYMDLRNRYLHRGVEQVPGEPGMVVVDSARSFVLPWSEFEERREAHEAAQRATAEDRERRKRVLVDATVRLREAFGVDLEDRGAGVRVDHSRVTVELHADTLGRLVEAVAGPALAPGAVPVALAGPASRSLAFVEQVKGADLSGFEAHELERVKSIALDAELRARWAVEQMDRALWERAHPEEAF